MTVFREIPPTAGFPLRLREIAAALTSGQGGDMLAGDFRQYLGAPYARTTCSGTAALYLICRAIEKLTPRRTIIIPSFICPLVPLAVRRAGFTVAVCDIEGGDFNFDPRSLAAQCAADRDVAAIVIDHLAGIPAELAALQDLARQHDILIIEDCAQALGALSQGRQVGTLGDFAFFSLAAGKGLTMYEGGMLVTRHANYANLLNAVAVRYAKKNAMMETIRGLELLGYWLFYRPSLFWFVFTLPQRAWRLLGNDMRALREGFTADFPLHAVSRFRTAVAHSAFSRLDGEILGQREKAQWYFRGLEGCSGLRIVREAAGDRATYPYVALIFDAPETRNNALQRCRGRAGAGVSQIYARAIGDYPYLKNIISAENCDNARVLAGRTLTLSTSAFLTEQDAAGVVRIIRGAL